jgi:hypothetical protein
MKATLLAPLVFCQTSFAAIFHHEAHEAHEAHEGFGHYYIPISSFVLFATFVVKGLFPILVAATPLRIARKFARLAQTFRYLEYSTTGN